jgi:DMSO/TMAO reductase YedYZ molybdopterin-dependent catalytic subunit
MDIPRRSLFMLVAGAFLRAQDRAKPDMLVRSTRPEDLEMLPSGFSDYITPIEHFFVRTHVHVPTVNASAWRLKIDGEVARPLTLTMDDLRMFPSVELVSVLECAGNGRGFYEPSVPGLQWGSGAVGNGRWKGVRLVDVLKRAGVRSTTQDILFDGADIPLGTMPDFQRSIPVKKAFDDNTLLAYEMNGETLPVKHGFPLRVVAPGWAGDSWVKWLTSIRVLDKEHDGFWMRNAYRHPGKPVAPGTAVPQEQMQPVTSLSVKSLITAPLDGAQIASGIPIMIRGVAWSGDAGPITVVDVSIDSGRTWKAATLRPGQRTAFGWRQWEFRWTPSRPSYYTILARARDMVGNAQPLDQEWNPAGYGWNIVPRASVDVGGEVTHTQALAPSSGSGVAQPGTFKSACLACHDDDVIRQQRLTRSQWEREIQKMTDWGARIRDEDREGFLDYLFSNYGPRGAGRPK